MAVYKVPQDVEAEDKLVGPFGFRQFVYLGIAGGLGFVGYLLLKISPFLIIIPLPVIFLLVILALPLRKEQPMETYLLALLRFYLKPKLRLWNTDGTITYVEIIVPKTIDQKLTKELTSETATERLDYLARIMDTRGWAAKGQEAPSPSLQASVAAEAQTAIDVLDEDAALAQSFATKIAQKDQQVKQQAMTQMRQAARTQSAQPADEEQKKSNQKQEENIAAPHFNPYPSSIHQRIIQPIDTKQTKTHATKPKQEQPTSAMPEAVSPDIIRLANNGDLSISAIAHEAHRLADKSNEEVVINLHNHS